MKQNNRGVMQVSYHVGQRRSFHNNQFSVKEISQELSFGSFIVKIATFKQELHDFKIALVFEKTIKRRQKLDRKTYAKLTTKMNRRYEEQQNRNQKIIQIIDLLKYLFDNRKYHPLTQFCNKQQLNELKNQVRESLSRPFTDVMKRVFSKKQSLPLHLDYSDIPLP